LTWHWHLLAMGSHLPGIGEYRSLGWVRIPFDMELFDWVSAALPAARDAVRAPENADWHVCEGTWFIGVNALPNAADGSVDGKTPLRGRAVETVAALGFSTCRWDRAQISVIYPGYPRPREGESAAAFAYRRYRDAAHVDGLTRVGSGQRMLREPHAFIMGVPLTQVGPDAGPLVIWEGSHEIMRGALAEVLLPAPSETWLDTDLTDAYQTARREAFKRCRRVFVSARPGEAYLVHRLALHGIAPSAPRTPDAAASRDGRMIAYFRPPLEGSIRDWIHRA